MTCFHLLKTTTTTGNIRQLSSYPFESVHVRSLQIYVRLTIARYVCRVCLSVGGSAVCEGRWNGRCLGELPCAQLYAGRHPLSEPETVAVANFIMQHRSSIRLYISLHSYSQMWLTPWGHNTTPPVDNDDLVSRQVSLLAELSPGKS